MKATITAPVFFSRYPQAKVKCETSMTLPANQIELEWRELSDYVQGSDSLFEKQTFRGLKVSDLV